MRFLGTGTGSAAALVTVAVLAGCGAGGGTNTSTAAGAAQGGQGGQGGGPFAQLTASQRSCLQKAGVTPGQRPGAGGAGGTGGGGGGQAPSTADRQARFQKMRAAFQKCGIQPPAGRPGNGGPPPGQAGSGGANQ
jgi:hypothetical protein